MLVAMLVLNEDTTCASTINFPLRAMALTSVLSEVPVTVVIPTLNEVDRLPACLASVRWADQVIVADAGSTDGTQELARSMGAIVIERCGPTIAEQRNIAIAASAHQWILALDADERVSPELARSIAQEIVAPRGSAFRVHMRNQYLGATMERGGWGRDRHVRLFRSSLRYEVKRVHEGLHFEGAAFDLAGRVDHDSYRDLGHQLAKVNCYAKWGAEDLFARGKQVGLVQIIMRPAWRFIKCYFLQGAILEGQRGLVLAVVHAWSAFAKYALLWDMQRMANAMVVKSAPSMSPVVALEDARAKRGDSLARTA